MKGGAGLIWGTNEGFGRDLRFYYEKYEQIASTVMKINLAPITIGLSTHHSPLFASASSSSALSHPASASPQLPAQYLVCHLLQEAAADEDTSLAAIHSHLQLVLMNWEEELEELQSFSRSQYFYTNQYESIDSQSFG